MIIPNVLPNEGLLYQFFVKISEPFQPFLLILGYGG
jgi:hypothetical protein